MKLPFELNSQTIYEKQKILTDEKKGKRPQDYSVNELIQKGIVLVDKPPGPTSHQTVEYLKNILDIQKAGHTGTLDPGVTGTLPVALNQATRITQSLLVAGKEYICLIHLHSDVADDELEEVFAAFRGEITQLPPKKSAVKRRFRKRNIYYLDLIERDERDVLIKVGCQAGTYIRKLAHDIGEYLKTGAHMTELRRTKAGPFQEKEIMTLQDIKDEWHYYNETGKTPSFLRPMEDGVAHLKKIWVGDPVVKTLTQGAYLKIPGIAKIQEGINKKDIVAVMTLKGELILVGEAQTYTKKMLEDIKGIAVKTQQVFMKPGVY